MDIEDWRRKIDDLDRQLVRLMNERAQCAHEIGRLKRNSAMPIYEPDRERIIFQNIAHANEGPLSDVQLRQVYERLRSEEHTSELQSLRHLVWRLLLEKKNKTDEVKARFVPDPERQAQNAPIPPL